MVHLIERRTNTYYQFLEVDGNKWTILTILEFRNRGPSSLLYIMYITLITLVAIDHFEITLNICGHLRLLDLIVYV